MVGPLPRAARPRVLPGGHRRVPAAIAFAVLFASLGPGGPAGPASAARAQDAPRVFAADGDGDADGGGRPARPADGKGKGDDDAKGRGKGAGGGKDGDNGGAGRDRASKGEDGRRHGRSGSGDGGKAGGTNSDGAAAKPPQKSEDALFLEAVVDAWRAGDARAVAARLPERRKVALSLPGIPACACRREQAATLLDDYFRARTMRAASLRAVDDMVGTAEIRYIRSADRREIAARLLLTVEVEDGRRVLAAVRESP